MKTTKRQRKKSKTLGKTRRTRQRRRCERMFRHKDTGRCIEVDGRLARELYPDEKKLMKAFKERPCRGELHQASGRYRCIDIYARRNKRIIGAIVRKRSKYAKKRSRSRSRSRSKSSSSELDKLIALLSKL